MKPILRPICILIKHRWTNAGDFDVCWRCGAVKRAGKPYVGPGISRPMEK